MDTLILPRDKPVSLKKLISGSCLIAGTAIGAGMLGIPAVTIECGFAPGILASALVWLFMLITGLLLLEVALKSPKDSNILSITQAHLGRFGRYFVGGMFVFLYYCLLVAYIAGGGPLLEEITTSLKLHFIPTNLHYILFTSLIGLILYLGIAWVDRINIALSLLMLVAFCLMFIGGVSGINIEKLSQGTTYSKLFLAIPILFGAFGYHNVIPTLCDYLERDRKTLRFSLILGTFIAFITYSTWQYLIIGSVDKSLLQATVKEGKTVIFALQEATNNPSLFIFGKYFGALALITSLLGVGLSMIDFFADGFKLISIKLNRFFLCLITFGPPLLFALFNRSVFTKALGVAGGIGESILNGLLPVALIFVSKYVITQSTNKLNLEKLFFLFLFLLGIGVVGIEIYALMR